MAVEAKRYLFEYRHDNSDWAFEVVATSPQDAQDRIKALAWAHYKGEIQAKLSIPGGRFIEAIRRLLF